MERSISENERNNQFAEIMRLKELLGNKHYKVQTETKPELITLDSKKAQKEVPSSSWFGNIFGILFTPSAPTKELNNPPVILQV